MLVFLLTLGQAGNRGWAVTGSRGWTVTGSRCWTATGSRCWIAPGSRCWIATGSRGWTGLEAGAVHLMMLFCRLRTFLTMLFSDGAFFKVEHIFDNAFSGSALSDGCKVL